MIRVKTGKKLDPFSLHQHHQYYSGLVTEPHQHFTWQPVGRMKFSCLFVAGEQVEARTQFSVVLFFQFTLMVVASR